jgi:hypothetical protein
MEAAMSMNEVRADWAEAAAIEFANLVSRGNVSDETVSDLVADLGHFAKLRLSLRDDEIIRLFENGIGMWLSECVDPDYDLGYDQSVKIVTELPEELVQQPGNTPQLIDDIGTKMAK